MNFEQKNSIGFVIYRTSSLIRKEMARRLKKYDITPEQWTILNTIYEKSSATQKELTDASFKDQANTARILAKLESKGMIIKLADKKDKRISLIRLTEKGFSLRNEIVEIASDLNNFLSEDMTEGQRNFILDTLNSLVEKIEKNK
jgi:DNA-binding MarR family transcriptional regulator